LPLLHPNLENCNRKNTRRAAISSNCLLPGFLTEKAPELFRGF
jgi:hypothetical protein